MATLNPYSNSLLMDAFRGSLSNAESLGRGFAVAPVGLMGDVNALARQYITPRLPQSVQGLLQAAPAAPTTEQILSNIPRASAPRRESAGMEQLGAAMNFKGPVDVARGAGRLAGNAVNEAMVYGRGPLASITPQPMRVIEKNPAPFIVKHGTNQPFEEFKSGMGVTAKHIYTTPEEYAQDAAKYGDTLITAQASPKSLIDFSSEGKLDKQTTTALKKAAKDAGITDKYYPFESFMDDLMNGQLYQKGGGSRDQDALLSELFSKYQAVKMPDATSGGGISKSVVFEDPSVLKVLKDEGLLGQQAKSTFTYPQEEAMRLAQQRAALPKEQFGLGLPPNNTAQQRADAMFPFDVYHGTNADIQVMNTAGKGKTSGAGAFVNDNPLAAETYVNASGGGNIIPMRMSKEGLLDVNAKGRNWADIETNTLAPKAGKKRYSLDEMELQKNDVTSTDELGMIAKDLLGLQGVNIKNVKDLGPNSHIFRAKEYLQDKYGIVPDETWSNVTGNQFAEARDYMDNLYKSQKSTVTAVQNPDLLRSRFAAFDPWRRTAAIASATGAAAPDLLAQEQPVITQQQIDDELAMYGLLGR